MDWNRPTAASVGTVRRRLGQERLDRDAERIRLRRRRLRRARCDAKLRAARVRVRTVLSENERLTLTNSCLIV